MIALRARVWPRRIQLTRSCRAFATARKTCSGTGFKPASFNGKMPTPRKCVNLWHAKIHGDVPNTSRKQTFGCTGKGQLTDWRRIDAGDRRALRRLSDECRARAGQAAGRESESSCREDSRRY